MDVVFADRDLDRLETDAGFTAGLPDAVVSRFRMRLATIRNANDERDFYALKSWRYEKLKGKRKHQRSIRLNDQWRLIVEVIEDPSGNQVKIVEVANYHKG